MHPALTTGLLPGLREAVAKKAVFLHSTDSVMIWWYVYKVRLVHRWWEKLLSTNITVPLEHVLPLFARYVHQHQFIIANKIYIYTCKRSCHVDGDVYYLRHSGSMHFSTCSNSSVHSPSSTGDLSIRCRVLKPFPQVTLQSLQSDHGVSKQGIVSV